jgi:hypothetical protein
MTPSQSGASLTKHPRRLARLAGVFYLLIIACALYAYLHVRGQVIVPGHMDLTAANVGAHAQLYRLGFTAAVVVVLCNPPMGLLICELLAVVDRRLARLALLFIVISTALEAVNLINYIAPLVVLTLPDSANAVPAGQRWMIAQIPLKLFGYLFDVSLAFFGSYCLIVGSLIVRSRFLPAVLGVAMLAAGAAYWIDDLSDFLAFRGVPYLGLVTLVAESALAAWLLVMGVNEQKWRAQAEASA